MNLEQEKRETSYSFFATELSTSIRTLRKMDSPEPMYPTGRRTDLPPNTPD